MSTLKQINDRHTEQVLAQAHKRLPCYLRNKENVGIVVDYIKRRMDGRIAGPKPHIRTRVHHRLMQIEHAAELKRLDELLKEWDEDERS